MSAPFFRIYLDQPQIGPDALNQIIQAAESELAQVRRTQQMGLEHILEVLLGADHHRVVLAGQLVHLFEADRIYLVVYV